jgi:hypothetical protein
MRKLLLSVVAATALLSGGSIFAAETTTRTTTTWTDEQGNLIREHSTVKHYSSFNDPKLEVRVGAALPETVTLYALPETIKVPDATQYSYVIINDKPVLVEKTTRKVIHTWEIGPVD